MAAKVTIQDIADALGISRNTVSKAINNTGVLADSTREKVLKKAAELGYKQFSYVTDENASLFGLCFSDTNISNKNASNKNASDKNASHAAISNAHISKAGESTEIALLTAGFSPHSGPMLDAFCKELSRSGYTLSMHRILPDESQNLCLPDSFIKEKTAGIACMGLFDATFSRLASSLSIPTLFIDSPAAFFMTPKTDYLYADSQPAIYRLIREMVKRGKKRIGFIGDYQHSHSFLERYLGYRNAMHLFGLPCPDESCITKIQEASYTPPLAKTLPTVPYGILPEPGGAS